MLSSALLLLLFFFWSNGGYTSSAESDHRKRGVENVKKMEELETSSLGEWTGER